MVDKIWFGYTISLKFTMFPHVQETLFDNAYTSLMRNMRFEERA